MNAIILKGAALRQPPLPQSGPQAKFKHSMGKLRNNMGIIQPLLQFICIHTEHPTTYKSV
jgi:hypothetical protein